MHIVHYYIQPMYLCHCLICLSENNNIYFYSLNNISESEVIGIDKSNTILFELKNNYLRLMNPFYQSYFLYP